MDGGISKTLFKERKAFFELSARDSSGEGISKTVFKERKDFFELSATGGASNQSTQKPRESKPPTGYMSQPIQGNIIVKNSNVSITEPASAGSSSNQSTQKTPESQSPTRPMPQPIEGNRTQEFIGLLKQFNIRIFLLIRYEYLFMHHHSKVTTQEVRNFCL